MLLPGGGKGSELFAEHSPPSIRHVELARAHGVRALVAHGGDDVGVDPERGWYAARALERAGPVVSRREVAGGHQLVPYLLAELSAWLESFGRRV